MRKKYPSDISREIFEKKVQPVLEKAKKKTKPRTLDLYEVFCAVLSVLKSGCPWRMLPEGFPAWESCYAYFAKWSLKREAEDSLLEEALKNAVGEVRQSLGRSAQTSFFIVDAQSVKNTDTAEQKGFDGGKLVSGIKRHIGVDTNGLPHMIYVTTANVTDRAGALEGFALYKSNLIHVVNVLVDGGYTVEVAKRSELHTFAVIPKRWVVERSFAWLEKCRRLWKNCERKLNTSLQMVALAFLVLLLKRS